MRASSSSTSSAPSGLLSLFRRRRHSSSALAGGGGFSGHSRLTPAVWLVAYVSATCGFMIGIQDGLSATRTASEPFARLFFPEPSPWQRAAAAAEAHTHPPTQQQRQAPPPVVPESPWCAPTAADAGGAGTRAMVTLLPAMQSLGTVAGALLGGWGSCAYGRRTSITAAACLYLAGVVLQALAWHLAQFEAGLVVAGVAIGLMVQAAPLEDAEIAPAQYRGRITGLQQIGYMAGTNLIVGVFSYPPIAQLPVGWRLVVTAGLWPAVGLLIVMPSLPETPSSLLQRGHLARGQEELARIRGPCVSSGAVTQEALDLWREAGCPLPHDGKSGPLRLHWITRQLRLLGQREQFPQLLVMLSLPIFLLFVVFVQASPASSVLISAFLGAQQEQMRAVIFAAVPSVAMVAGVLLLDTLGRRFLLLLFTGTGVLVNAALGALLVAQPQQQAAMMAIYTFGQAVQSFGWPVVSVFVAENFPVSVRSAAMAATQAVAYASQAGALFGAAALLCSLRERVFFAWSGSCAAALLIVGLLLPETKRLELASVPAAWRQHWLWRHWYARLAAGGGSGGAGAGTLGGGAAAALVQPGGRPLALGMAAPSEDMMRGLSLATTSSF